jgi:hypothetical protein
MPDLTEIQEPMVLLEMQEMLVQQEITDTVEQQVIREITEHQEIQEIMEAVAAGVPVAAAEGVDMEQNRLTLSTQEKVDTISQVMQGIMGPTVMEVMLLQDLIADMEAEL